MTAGLARSFGATATRTSARRAKAIGGEIEGAAAVARAIAPAAAFDQAGSLGLGRPSPSGDRRPGSRIFGSRSAVAAGASAAGWADGQVEQTQRARISASAAGASGKAENVQAAACVAAETGSSPPLTRSCRLSARALALGAGRSRAVAAARIRPGSRLGGRLASSRHSRSSRAAGPGFAGGEAQVAQGRRVGVEAQDLRAGCGAHEGEAGAQRPGKAGRGADGRQAGRGWRRRRTGDRPPLPFRSPAPRPEPGAGEVQRVVLSKGFR